MFFEGPEKKVEIITSDVHLRHLGEQYWRDIARRCGAEVLSKISNHELDAYLLSESSLFVWPNRVVIITCGSTVLLTSILQLIKDLGPEHIESLIFQRKNEYDQSQQKSSFTEDVRMLREVVGGHAHRFGHLDGHHHFIFNLAKPYQPLPQDTTSELLMYHINGPAAETLRNHNPGERTRQAIREMLKLDTLLEGFAIDEHLFQPCGYSMNAIKGPRYITIHATPQKEYSYVSCETSLDVATNYAYLLPTMVDALRPDSFDLLTFDIAVGEKFDPRYFKWEHVQKQLSCGYNTQFSHYVSTACQPRIPRSL